ncbi:MAG: protease complex subunit PrcB family protein [Elusimicrobiota bacterium]
MRGLILVLAAAAAAHGMGRRPPAEKEPAQREDRAMDVSQMTVKDGASASWQGASCGVSKAASLKVESAEEWEKLWKDAFNREAPAVDFSTRFAVAVFLGLRQTGGYSVEFLEPAARADTAVIRYRTRAPGPGAFVIQAFTTPYAIRLYNKTSAPVAVEESK